GLPRVPVLAGGPAAERQALLPAARRVAGRRPDQAVPDARARHDRPGVRRLGEGERGPLRRRGDLRPDLSAGQEVAVRGRSALPTAVGGIALTAVYSTNGWVGRLVEPLGLKVAYAPLGVVVALTFVGLPFVVRTIQPVLRELDRGPEEAAATLGASRLQTVRL